MKQIFPKSASPVVVFAAVAFGTTLTIADLAAAQVIHRTGRTMPDYVVVNRGDTMWDLSGAYYGDNYMWPRMWGYNAHVTNPHWIYPGDILYLKSPNSGPDSGGEPEQDGPTILTSRQPGSLNLPVAGFVSKDRVEYAGRIIASPKPANMLSPLDKAWVGFGDDAYSAEEKEDLEAEQRDALKDAKKPAVGDVFVIIREDGLLEDEEGEVGGHKYFVIGTLRVTEVSDKYHDTAEIVQAWQEIERGDYLIPYERQLKNVQPVQSNKDLVAKIVDSIEPVSQFGEHHYVFVNKGADDGVRVGNRMFIYQRFEGLTESTDDEKVPWQRIGQVLVIDVRKNFSLAVITDSAREIHKGDRLEMYSGY